MFITHESGRLHYADELFAPGVESWDYVTLDFWVPWFIVTLNSVDEDGNPWSSPVCLHRVAQLAEATQDSGSTVSRVQLLSPIDSHPRGWHLDEVSEVNRCFQDSDESYLYELVFVSGQSTWLPIGSSNTFSNQLTSKQELWKR